MSDVPLPTDTPESPGASFMKGWQRQAPVPPEGHWDEWRRQLSVATPPGLIGPGPAPLWREFVERLGPEGAAGLPARMAQLQRQVQDNGITYNVYAQADRPERPWALDLFPLLLGSSEWAHIEQGVRQRMRLIEHILEDVYGPRQLLARGLLPSALVQGHPGYLHAMQGVQPVGGQRLSLAAFDLARGPDGLWWMLSQRTQAPSGLGYLLENRLIISRLFPEAFEALHVQRLADTYRQFIAGLQARCPCAEGESPHIALLTPGPYNETYFEHAYLARYLGLSLVQAGDLTVRGQRLYLKTLQGLQRVHALIKRVDDPWLDPLELRADSSLGVPGLLEAVRAGELLMANPPGTGFLESNALLGFLPALAEEILGEELVLPAIPSWWCGEAAAVPDALTHLPEGVIKAAYPHDENGRGFEPVQGRGLDAAARAEWAGRIARDAEAHLVQSWLPLSHLPVWKTDAGMDSPGHMETRPVILRVFALADADNGTWQVLPGGLARLGTPDGIDTMQRGGSSADVWVQAPESEAVRATTLLGRPLDLDRPRLVTSRAAENLFWTGRYTERTENSLRLTRLALELLASQPPGHSRLLQWLERLVRSQGLIRTSPPGSLASLRVFERSLVASLWDTEHCTGVGFNWRAMLRSASSIRERFSPEHWQMLEHGEQTFFSHGQGQSLPPTPQTLLRLRESSVQLAAITGGQTDRMSRDDGWRLLSIGRHIERLDFLAEALGLALSCDLLSEAAGFDALLELFDSSISFHAQYQQSRAPQALVSLLVTSTDNPRSVAWVAQTLRARLLRMGHLADGATEALAAKVPPRATTLALWPLDAQQAPALANWLQAQRLCARQVAEGLSAQFFTHSRQQAQSVGS